MSKTQTRFLTAQLMQFITGAVPRGTLQLTSLAGEESISRPYEYRLELAARDKDLDLDALLREKAHISIRQGVKLPGDELGARVLRVHGVLRSFVQVGRELDWVKYRAVLVPTLWRLSLGRASRVFQGRRIPEIVQEVAEAYGVRVDLGKLKLGNFKQREYVVQYEESDLDFIHRWLEREGIYYYFEQTEDGERMVLGHSSEAYGKLLGDATFRFKPLPEHKNVEAVDSDAASDDWFAEETVNELVAETRPLPRRVVLNDYNWRNPGANLRIEETVSEDGAGDVYLYNQHYETESEGRALAKLRAQELICRRIEFTGRGECRGFRAGHTFTLDEHFRAGFNQDYLLVQVRHTASQGLSLGSGNQGGASYRNEFTAIPASCEYRPPSVTKWPQISGFMHARVDGPDTGTPYAQHDANGQYRVRMPLDLGDAADGAASRPVRKGEAYAGPGQGMHFPLLRGSEVMMSHIDGDPDRPVIACAVYNNDTPSVSTADNATQNVIKTPIGSRIVMDDTEGTHYIRIHTADEKNRINLDATDGAEAVTIRSTVSNSTMRLGKSQGEATPAGLTNADGLYFNADGDVNVLAGTNLNQHAGKDANVYVGGVKTETIVQDYNLTVNGSLKKSVKGDESWWTEGNEFKGHNGHKAMMLFGSETKGVFGFKNDVVLGEEGKFVRGLKFDIFHGGKITSSKKWLKEFVVGPKEEKAKSWKVEAEESCQLTSEKDSVTVSAKKAITLACGQASLTLKADGTITLGNSKASLNIAKNGTIELRSKPAPAPKVPGGPSQPPGTGGMGRMGGPMMPAQLGGPGGPGLPPGMGGAVAMPAGMGGAAMMPAGMGGAAMGALGGLGAMAMPVMGAAGAAQGALAAQQAMAAGAAQQQAMAAAAKAADEATKAAIRNMGGAAGASQAASGAPQLAGAASQASTAASQAASKSADDALRATARQATDAAKRADGFQSASNATAAPAQMAAHGAALAAMPGAQVVGVAGMASGAVIGLFGSKVYVKGASGGIQLNK